MCMTPARLNEPINKGVSERIDDWALSHAYIILPIVLIIGAVLVVVLAYTLVGVSATESGTLRNFLIRGI